MLSKVLSDMLAKSQEIWLAYLSGVQENQFQMITTYISK